MTAYQPTPEELKAAFANLHMHNFADFLLWAVSLAAQKEPERLKQALQDVFSPGAVASTYRRAAVQAEESLKVAREAADLLNQVARQIDEIEKRLDAVVLHQDKIAAWIHAQRRQAQTDEVNA